MGSDKLRFPLIYLFTFLSIISSICGEKIDWSLLACDDSLVLYFKDMPMGMLYNLTTVDTIKKIITKKSRVEINPDPGALISISSTEMEEICYYDFNGNQVGGRQTLDSQTGKSTWDLKKNEGIWTLTVSASGIPKKTEIKEIKGSLKTVYAIFSGIKMENIVSGQVWHDTVFDFTSAKNMDIKITCDGMPDNTSSNYVFTNHIDLIGIDERWEVNPSGRVVLQQVATIFTAKKVPNQMRNKKYMPHKKGKKISVSSLFNIPIKEKQMWGERVALTIKNKSTLPKSATTFYTIQKDKYVLNNLPETCKGSDLPNKILGKEKWLSATITIQSDHPEIKQVANKLKGNFKDRCEIINHFNNYVYKTIKKKNVATFSNAYETLKAGYGDCGEHAVLLTALLRAVGIESNVVLGLMLIPGKSEYGYHAWVAAYADYLIFVDPSWDRFAVANGYIPLIVDDDGTNMVQLAGLIDNIAISYLPIE